MKLDSNLTSSAISRAAEVAVHIPTTSPHLRADGRRSNTINKRINYECCSESVGIYDTQAIVDNWMGSKAHRAGILLKSAKSVGISCVTVGSKDAQEMVWVLDFSKSNAQKAVKTNKSKTYSKKVKILNSYAKKVKILNSYAKKGKIKFYDSMAYPDSVMESPYEVELGEKAQLTAGFTSKETAFLAPLMGKSFTWKSSNPSVATVSKTGKITAKKVGTTKITAKLKNGTKKKASIKVVVEEYGEDSYYDEY